MKISKLVKSSFKLPIITLIATLQITACSTEEGQANQDASQISAARKYSTTPQAAIFSGTDSAWIREDDDPDGDNLLEVNAKLKVIDSNAGEAAVIADTISGSYGELTIDADGHWLYTAANDQPAVQALSKGESMQDILTISSIDGTTHAITITIKGVDDAIISDTVIIEKPVEEPAIIEPNSPAIISGVNTGTVTEDIDPDADGLLEVRAKLNISDSDAGEAAFIAKTVTGYFGNLRIDTAGSWYYAANNAQTVIQNLASGSSLTDRLSISSIDGTSHTVSITILGADEAEASSAAIISGVDSGTVTEDIDPDADGLLEVRAKLNISDSDAGEAAFIAKTVTGKYGSLSIDTAGSWQYAANNEQTAIQNLAGGSSLTDSLTVSSVDNTTHTVVITILGADEISTVSDVNLSWLAPSEREDNTALSLSEIAGYKIKFGTASGQYANNIVINDGSAVAYTIKNLTTGTYYFTITTFDTDGVESSNSAEVTFTL